MQTDEEIGKVAAAVPVIICILSGAVGMGEWGSPAAPGSLFVDWATTLRSP